MYLEIITPDHKLFTGEVKLVNVPGSKGRFAVLHNHAPIISTLEQGKVKVVNSKDETKYFEISGGLVEVMKNKIILLAEE